MDIEFNSEDIKNQHKTEYFVNTRKKPELRAFFVSLNQKSLFRGWRKFALLGVLIVSIIVPIIILGIVNKPQSPEESAVETLPVRVAQDVYEEALAVSKSGSASAYFDALAVFDDAITERSGEESKNEIRILKAEFYKRNNALDDALLLLTELKNSENITSGQQTDIYTMMMNIYTGLGDEGMAQQLLNELNELYPGGK